MKQVLLLVLLMSCASEMSERTKKMKEEYIRLWDYSNPEKTRKAFLNYKDTSSSDEELALKTQIARTYSLQAKFSEAHHILDEIQPQLAKTNSIVKTRYHLERGRTFNSAGEKEKATLEFEKAFKTGTEARLDVLAIDAIHMLVIAASKLEKKLEWTQVGIETAKNSEVEEARKWIGVFHNNKGWDLFDSQNYSEALVEFEACADFYQKMGAKERHDIALWSKAKTLRMLGKIDESFAIQNKLLDQNNGQDPSGYTFEELGELYALKQDKDQARYFFKKAYAILSKDTWLLRNESKRLERLKNF